jgi:hypothetical protein
VTEGKPERRNERGPERKRGFALLLVFAMAASVAILIYLEIPRVAFERQRDKEALLVDRGEQYSRAIELYARKMKKYPQNLDDLEHAQTVRFLRRRYKDPMTGKDEWRLVHMNANGQYVDSKVHKATGALEKEDKGPSVLASKIQGIGQAATLINQDGQGVSAALQKHASDRISPGSTGTAGASDASQGAAADGTQDPNQANNAAQVGSAAGSARFPVQSAAGSSQGTAQDSSLSSTLPSSQQDTTGSAASSSSTTQSQAIQAVQAVLGSQSASTTTTSRTGSTGASQSGGVASGLGAGLVGVATTVEMEGIRRYKDHSNYSEWEFVYDPKDTSNKSSATAQGKSGSTSSSSTDSTFGGMTGGVPAPPGSSLNN